MKSKSKRVQLAERRCRDRRRRAQQFCPKCFTMAQVTNEVYDSRMNQPGWEWDCPWCRYHWHVYVNEAGRIVREWYDPKANRWKKI